MMTPIEGFCDARFSELGEAFRANLDEEIGAAVAVRIGDKVVVDLCGGWADSGRRRPWTADTVVATFSTGKACAALTVLSLGLDLDAPAFQDATLRQVLSHQAGHPAVRVDVPERLIYDWDWVVEAIESQEPWWEPGATHGYHVNTFGFLCGAVVRRASGDTLPDHFAKLVGDETGVVFGARSKGEIAEFVFDHDSGAPDSAEVKIDPERQHLLARAYFNPPGLSGIGTVNTPEWRAAEIPSCNLHARARGLVEVFSRMPRLLGEDVLAEAIHPWSDGHDFVLDRQTRFGLGFQLPQPDRPMGPGPRAFGHFGAGGSLGFHDPDLDLSFAYVCNRCEGRRWQTRRNRRLLEALSAAL